MIPEVKVSIQPEEYRKLKVKLRWCVAVAGSLLRASTQLFSVVWTICQYEELRPAAVVFGVLLVGMRRTDTVVDE